MKFSEVVLQSMFFTKLVIAGLGTIYNTRTVGCFWKNPYATWLLFNASFSTVIIGTLIAIYGIFITPISWEYALRMWIYALTWFVVNDIFSVNHLQIYEEALAFILDKQTCFVTIVAA